MTTQAIESLAIRMHEANSKRDYSLYNSLKAYSRKLSREDQDKLYQESLRLKKLNEESNNANFYYLNKNL